MKKNTTIVAMATGLALAAAVAGAETAWIITTDFTTYGNVRSVECADPWPVSGDLATIPADAAGRHHDGLVYLVGRGSWDLVQIRDPEDGFSLVREFSLGTGLNPQDIAFDGEGEAYVSCYDTAVLLRVDPTAGTVLQSFDTSGFADADGLPETSWMVAVGDLLYITCQRLDTANWYAPTGPGALLVFDMAAEAWVDMDPAVSGVQPIALQGANPYTRILVDDGLLTVGCVGYFGLADGGVENVDPAAGVSLGYEVTETALGGDVNRIQRDGDELVAIINDAAFHTSVVRTGPGGTQVLDAASGFVHADIWLHGGDLYVADRTPGEAGLRVLDPLTGVERSEGTISTGLPPFLLIPPEAAPVSGVPAALPAPLVLGAPRPNPCNPAADLALDGTPGRTVRIDVVDCRGRRVGGRRVLLDGDGNGDFRFTGVDRQGRGLAAGVYHVIATSDGGSDRRRVTLVK